jgi:hypothetical protein
MSGKEKNIVLKIRALALLAVRLVIELEHVGDKKKCFDTHVGLKRKFSFSYFRENFAKIGFRFSRKKLTKSYENKESFRKNDAESETAVKHPNSKRQKKFRS